MAEQFPEWLRAEEEVGKLFSLLGFRTESITYLGRQIDIIATRHDALSIKPEKWAIEVTIEKVDNDKGPKDYVKLSMFQKKGYKALLVSTKGFTNPQKEALEECDVVCLTYQELEARILDLHRYATVTERELNRPRDNDIGYNPQVYIDPSIRVHRDAGSDATPIHTTATQWVQEICSAKTGVVGALLGNLGTGKTTILQHSQLAMIKTFFDNPSENVLPIYIPLSRYKQHSGWVDGILHEVLASAGQSNYPTTFIRWLASTGRIVFFFDGLDEVHPIQSIDDVVTTVTNILSYLGKNARAIISSRTHLFASASEEFGIFGPYEKKKLTRVAGELRKMLAGHASTELAYVLPFNRLQIDGYLKSTCGNDVEAVKAQISSIYGFGEMAQTPVLLAMMTKTLPELIQKKHAFSAFPQIDLYETYTGRWIDRDTGRAQLSAEQRMRLSYALASDLIQRDEYSASWTEIQNIICNDPAWRDQPIGESAAQLDVRNSTFLIREDNDQFRFVHRSIMEFFAAEKTYEELLSGAGNYRALSDGHVKFLSFLVARGWIENNGDVPFPHRRLSVDDWGDRNYLSLLASASNDIPSSYARKCRLSGFLVKGRELGTVRFENVNIENTTIETERISALSLVNCVLEGVKIISKDIGKIELEKIACNDSEIRLPSEQWKKVRLYPETTGSLSPLKIDNYISIASEWNSVGSNRAFIDGAEWIIDSGILERSAFIASRLRGKVKLNIESWEKAAQQADYPDLFDVLKSHHLIEEDTSRTPHQITLTQAGNDLLKQIEQNPLSAHDRLVRVFKPQSRRS